jgi:hypothetical protein
MAPKSGAHGPAIFTFLWNDAVSFRWETLL